MALICALLHESANHSSCVISGFCRVADEIRARLGYYTASTGNLLPTFRVNLLVPSSGFKNPKRLSFGFLNPEDGTNRLFQNVCKKLPLIIIIIIIINSCYPLRDTGHQQNTAI